MNMGYKAMWKDKFEPSEHEVLVESSFTDYTEEKNNSVLKAVYSRLDGAIRSRWFYKTAEKKVRKQFPIVVKAQEKARLDGGLIGQYQWVRLNEIARFVNLFNVKSVCEFGSGGGSTTMFSQLGLNHFVSLEENDMWYERTKQCLPDGAKVELLRKDRLSIEYDGEPCTRYDLPDEFYQQHFDLVYIDGPTSRPLSENESSLPILDKSKQMMPNVDIELFFENGSFPRVILIDARRPTVRRICQKYSHRYDIFLRYYYKSPQDRAGEFLYHTVMVRK